MLQISGTKLLRLPQPMPIGMKLPPLGSGAYSGVPHKSPVWWETTKDIIKTGLDVWKGIETTKQTKKIEIPRQDILSPYIIKVPDRPVSQYQPQGNIDFSDIVGVIKTTAQAPLLVERAERVGQKAQYTGWIIGGAIVLLAIVLLTRR